MPNNPVPRPSVDAPRLEWQSLQGMRSQLPVGDYSQYDLAFCRANAADPGAPVSVHAIQGQNTYMNLVAMGFQVSVMPVGYAMAIDGDVGYYLAPDLLAQARRGETLSIPIDSYHLFSKTGLTLDSRIWFIGIDALRAYFRQEPPSPSGSAHAWFRDRMEGYGGWAPPFQTELALLGLQTMPATLADLKRAWKERLRACHPDMGGDTAEAQAISAAYETLRSHFATWQ